MLKYSLATAKSGQTIIKIHHDFGDFNFYLVPDPQHPDSFGWASDPMIKDKKVGDSIALKAATSIAHFTRNTPGEMSFGEMVVALKNAAEIAG